MRAAYKLSLPALLCCLLAPSSLHAQELKCDSVRPLPSSSSAYKNRGNRCEGLYVADVGSRSIDMSSGVDYLEVADQSQVSNDRVTLKIRVELP